MEKNTASIIGNNSAKGNIIIPRSIKYESKEYIIKSISKYAFASMKIESVEFSSDTEIQTIEGQAFTISLTKFSIPRSLTELKEGWCFGTSKLFTIDVSPENQYYKKYGENLIIGRSSLEQETFDILVFCSRNVQTIKIPSFIRVIGRCSFNDCPNLLFVEIPIDSKLEIIEKEAFAYSPINFFIVPPHLTQICEKAFFGCENFQECVIPHDCSLQIIGKEAFASSSIESITIPKNLVELRYEWCCNTVELTTIDVSPENKYFKNYEDKFILGKSTKNQEDFDVLVFCVRDIEYVKIPSFIKHIGSFAFSDCISILKFEIPDDSNLISIEKNAFYNSSIENLTIPSKLVDLKDEWCNELRDLYSVTVSPTNKRYTILDEDLILGKSSCEQDNFNVLVFGVRDIKFLKIPSFIKHIGPYAFHRCEALHSVEFSADSELETIDQFAFSCSSIKEIKIPSSVKLIGERAFNNCFLLKKVEFETNSNLQTICDSAFFRAPIDKISLPSSITQLEKSAFVHCIYLRKVEIPKNSNLQLINDSAFSSSKIECISIPSHVTFIGNFVFAFCKKLKIIEFDENSEINCIETDAFQRCKKVVLIMIPAKLKEHFKLVYEKTVIIKI